MRAIEAGHLLSQGVSRDLVGAPNEAQSNNPCPIRFLCHGPQVKTL